QRSPGHHRYPQRRQRREIRARARLEGERADPHCPHLAAVGISQVGIRAAVAVVAKPIAEAAQIGVIPLSPTGRVGADRCGAWACGAARNFCHPPPLLFSVPLTGGTMLPNLWPGLSAASPFGPAQKKETLMPAITPHTVRECP